MNRNSFTSSFSIWMNAFDFSSCLIALAKISSTMLNESWWTGILVLILEENIQPFTLKYDVNCRVFVDTFHQVEEIPFYLFVDFFLLLLRQGDGFCEYFFCIYWNDCIFLYLFCDCSQHCIDLLLYAEPALCAYLVLVYSPFYHAVCCCCCCPFSRVRLCATP